VEVDISGSLLLLSLVIELWPWLEDSNSNFPAIDRTFLLGDAEDLRTGSSAIRNGILVRILTEVFYRHFVRVKSSGIECVVVCDVDRVIPRKKLGWNTVVKWLSDGWNPKL
jgi:hypothetical protein